MSFPNRQHVALGAANSNLTGAIWYTGDFNEISVSIQSSTASASRYTIIGTNADGFQSALGTPSQTVPAGGWSILTTLLGEGMYTVAPGARWITAFRDTISVSANSNVTMTFAGRSL